MSFVESHFLQTSVISPKSPPNRSGLRGTMTISVPEKGHADEAPTSGGISWRVTSSPLAEARQRISDRQSFSLKLGHNADEPHRKRQDAADLRPRALAAHS